MSAFIPTFLSLQSLILFILERGTDISSQLARLLAKKERLTQEYEDAAHEARKVLHEYDMLALDMRAWTKRRATTREQAELARQGLLGVDFKEKVEPPQPTPAQLVASAEAANQAMLAMEGRPKVY